MATFALITPTRTATNQSLLGDLQELLDGLRGFFSKKAELPSKKWDQLRPDNEFAWAVYGRTIPLNPAGVIDDDIT
jgi:hypothetical protein